MKKITSINILLAIFIVIVSSLQVIAATPSLPMQIYGAVITDGTPAQDGTRVLVKFDNQTIAQTTAKNGKYGYDPLLLIIPDDLSTTNVKEGPLGNERVQLYVNDVFALNLTFSQTYQKRDLNVILPCNDAWICDSNFKAHRLTDCSITERTRCDNGCVNGECLSAPTNTQTDTSQTTVCNPLWDCAAWGTCTNGIQTRTCTDKNNCNKLTGKPQEKQACVSTTPYTPQKPVEQPGVPEIEPGPIIPPEEEQPIVVKTPTILDIIKKFVWIIASAIGAILIIGLVLAFIVFKKKPAKITANLEAQRTQLSMQSTQESSKYTQLQAYINRMRQSRYTGMQIRQALINAGWPPQIIDEQLNLIMPTKQTMRPTIQPGIQAGLNRPSVQIPTEEPHALQLLHYIRKERIKGISDEQIQRALLNVGWDSTLVQQEMQKK